MKKLKFLLLAFIATTALTGCTEKYFTEQYYGAQIHTYQYEIIPLQWNKNMGALPGGNNYLYATFENSDITEKVMNEGTVTAEVWNIYDTYNNIGSWNPLPYVYPLEITKTDENNNPYTVIVPENIRFEWELGKVTFIIQDLDGYDPEDIVSPLTIRVNVIENY